MIKEVKFELLKHFDNRSFLFWVLVGLIYTVSAIYRTSLNEVYVYEEIRLEKIIYIIDYILNFALLYYVINITTKEFERKTIYFAMFEGYSRSDIYFNRTLHILVVLIFLFLISRILLISVFSISGYSLESIFYVLFNWKQVIRFFLAMYVTGISGLFLGLITKNGFWSLGIFLIIIILESLTLMITELKPLFKYAFYLNNLSSFRYGQEITSFAIIYLLLAQFVMSIVSYKIILSIKWRQKT